MIDIHSHILPNIDDGSVSIEQSVNILKLLKNNKVEIVVATPHFNLSQNTIDEFIENRNKAYNNLMEHVSDDLPKILKGAEVLLTSEVAELKDLNKLCIENTNYILIEMPYAYWTDWVYQALYTIISEHNLIPIIAHIERYRKFINDSSKINKLLSMNVISQVNANSIVRLRTRRLCFLLIRKNMCHIIASDTHDDVIRMPKILKAYKILAKKFGEAFVEDLDANAEYILNNQITDTGYQYEIKNFFGMWV